MIAFAEIDSDVFNLNKLGLVPETDINLVFDATQFACDLATKCGQYKEYQVMTKDITVEVPPPDQITGPIEIIHAEEYECQSTKGLFRCVIDGYEIGKEQTALCDPYEHSEFKIEFPANEDLYYSLKYKISNDDYLETLLYLKFKVEEVQVAGGVKYMLIGKLMGSVLFFDLDQLGKYAEVIHPNVGDIVAIDFPDENNREQYDITECFDKQLTQDGINPLLHKYVWKCKARRHIGSFEKNDPEMTEADKRLIEKHEYDAVVSEEVVKEVSKYDVLDEERGISEDAVYGGYELDSGRIKNYDKQDVRNRPAEKYDFLDEDTAIDIMRFGCGSRLVTDGYSLIFVTSDGDPYVVAIVDHSPVVQGADFESGLRWIKATDAEIVFVNIDGQSSVVSRDENYTDDKLEINLNSLYDVTFDTEKQINANEQNFLKFKGTRSYMWADQHHLYAKLQSNKKLYQII